MMFMCFAGHKDDSDVTSGRFQYWQEADCDKEMTEVIDLQLEC